MAELIPKKTSSTYCTSTTTPSKGKTTFFACFGFNRKTSSSSSRPRRSKSSPSSALIEKETNYIRSSHHQHDDHHKDNKNKIKSSTSTRRLYLNSWSSWRFRANKSATKTVPIDTSSSTSTVTDKQEPRPSKLKSTSRSRSKSSGKLASNSEREVLPVTTDGKRPGGPPQKEPPVSDLQTPHTPQPQPQPQPQFQANTLNLENRRHVDSPKGDIRQKRLSFCRKVDSIRASREPGSPVQEEIKKPKSRNTTTRTAAVMSHSLSFPSQKREIGRTANNPSAQNNNNKHATTTVSNKAASKNNQAAETSMIISNKRLDPVVGMSIIMATLIIMLLWGRLCAVLCTSAWFYFLPRLRSAATTSTSTIDRESNMNPSVLDSNFNSEEYKKKVVLGGFLERNHLNNKSFNELHS